MLLPLRTFSLSTLAFLTGALLASLAPPATAATAPPAGQLYVFESDGNGFNTKTVFYDDGREVVAFDAQFTPAAAEQALAFLRQKTSHPLRYLVVTHPNPDKFLGAPVFQRAGAKVVMSDATAANLPAVYAYKKYYFVQVAKAFTDATFPASVKPDQTFADTQTLRLAGGGTVELRELHQAGIAANQTVAYLKSANALIVGDLVHHHAHAWLEGPIVDGKAAYHTAPWVATLRTLAKTYPPATVVYGGRGEAVTASVALPAQIAYLEAAEKLTRTYVQARPGATLAEQKAAVDYAALTKAFEAAFPAYSLPYLVTYGAYGLVGSL